MDHFYNSLYFYILDMGAAKYIKNMCVIAHGFIQTLSLFKKCKRDPLPSAFFVALCACGLVEEFRVIDRNPAGKI